MNINERREIWEYVKSRGIYPTDMISGSTWEAIIEMVGELTIDPTIEFDTTLLDKKDQIQFRMMMNSGVKVTVAKLPKPNPPKPNT